MVARNVRDDTPDASTPACSGSTTSAAAASGDAGWFVTATTRLVPRWRSAAVTVSGVLPDAEIATKTTSRDGGVAASAEANSTHAGTPARPKLHGGIERGVSGAAEAGEDDPDLAFERRDLAQRTALGAVCVEQAGQHGRLAEHVLEQRRGPVGRHEVAISARIPSVGAHSHSGRYVAA